MSYAQAFRQYQEDIGRSKMTVNEVFAVDAIRSKRQYSLSDLRFAIAYDTIIQDITDGYTDITMDNAVDVARKIANDQMAVLHETLDKYAN